MHAADQVPQLGQGRLGLDVRLVEEDPGALGVVAELRLGPAELHRQRDQPLLGAVVQVALDPPPLGLGRVHHPLAADLELGDPGGQVAGGDSSHRARAASAIARPRVTCGAASSSSAPAGRRRRRAARARASAVSPMLGAAARQQPRGTAAA